MVVDSKYNPANKLIDAFDEMNACADEDEVWKSSHKLIEAIGGNHIVNSKILNSNTSVIWFRTSMHDAWIDEYLGCGYLKGDTILKELIGKSDNIVIESGTLTNDYQTDNLEVDFNRGLNDAGYGTLMSQSFACKSNQTTNFVTVCFDKSNSELKNINAERVKVIQSILSIFLSKPPNMNSPGIVKTGVYGLSPRERDVLALLAHGHQTSRIADKLNVSNVMVSKHFANARKKLGAATREQALALAMAAGLISI